MDTFGTTAVLSVVVFKICDLLKFIRAKDWNATLTMVIAFTAGTFGALLVAQTQFAADLQVGGFALTSLSFADAVVFGLVAGCGAGVLHDTVQAVDNSDSARKPSLLEGETRSTS